jgi:peptidoglycan/LPS O-acetylase OafA/YrhL
MDAVDEEESTQVEKKRVMLIVVRFLRGLAVLQIDIFHFSSDWITVEKRREARALSGKCQLKR